jgi:hypothetical protein
MTVNKRLRQAFVALMARAGTRITPTSRRRQGRPGPPERIYRLPNCRRLRLRTSATGPKFAMANKGTTAKDPFPFEADHFLGLIFFRSGGQAVGYLIPSAIAAQGIRATPPRAHRRDGHIWSFSVDDHPEWSEYRVGEIDFDSTSRTRGQHAAQTRLEAAIAKARRLVASAAGKPESAVRISID